MLESISLSNSSIFSFKASTSSSSNAASSSPIFTVTIKSFLSLLASFDDITADNTVFASSADFPFPVYASN